MNKLSPTVREREPAVAAGIRTGPCPDAGRPGHAALRSAPRSVALWFYQRMLELHQGGIRGTRAQTGAAAAGTVGLSGGEVAG